MKFQKQTQVAEKTQMSFSVKLVASLSLLIGVVLGGYLLNMSGATSLTSCKDTNCTVTAAIRNAVNTINGNINSQSWTYIYGSNKRTASDYNNLKNAINEGADVKVLWWQNLRECDRIFVSGNPRAVNCYFDEIPVIEEGSMVASHRKRISMGTDDDGTYSYDKVLYNSDGTFTVESKNDPVIIKWFVKK